MDSSTSRRPLSVKEAKLRLLSLSEDSLPVDSLSGAIRQHPYSAVALGLLSGFALGRSPELRKLAEKKLIELISLL